jgi:hypothetical protein
MGVSALRRAILEPAARGGHPIDDSTVNLLVSQTEGREGALPLLQFVLMRIWDGMTHGVIPAQTVERLGGVGGALAAEAQQLYDRLDPDQGQIARRAFLAMIRLGEGERDTRRRAPLAEIVAQDDPAKVGAVIQVFAKPDKRLISLAGTEGAPTAEVTHEALLDRWDLLKDWLRDSREDVRFKRRLAAAAMSWNSQAHPEGLLWRPPDLDLLRDFQRRAGPEMTPLELQFFRSSERKFKLGRWLRRLAISGFLIFLTAYAVAIVVAVLSESDVLLAVTVPEPDPIVPEYVDREKKGIFLGAFTVFEVIAAECQGEGINDVRLYYERLASAATLGLWIPLRVLFRCKAPPTSGSVFSVPQPSNP